MKKFDNFDVDIGIRDNGICGMQNVKCEDCLMGKFLGYDSDKDELCDHELVFAFSSFVRTMVDEEIDKRFDI